MTEKASDFGEFNPKIYLGYVVSMICVFFCIFKGIKLSGKITIYTAIAPYILLMILLIRGVFLDGAFDGLIYLLKPDLSKLFSLSVWVDAINQVFFQISIGIIAFQLNIINKFFNLGVGIVTLFGSYRKKNEDIKASSFYIPYAVAFCGILASLTIFTYIGNMSSEANIPISKIPLGGPG